jgi:MFS transporter, PAT family, beta-lactamase induction signal transducer AmpG
VPHPVVWLILYLPFGALGGFVSVALTFLATQHGLSIAEGALLNGASLLTQWLKWIWAPLVDISLSPKRWYVLSTGASALGILVMAAMPMSPETLGLLLAVIAVTSLINSVVGMAVESLIATSTPPDQVGRVSAWFQAGNLGGAGLGGGLGLLLITKLPQSWMSGAVLGTLFMACCMALSWAPEGTQAGPGKPMAAIKGVVVSLWQMLKTKSGLLSGILCILPIGTGAAQGVLTQAKVAEHWGAGATEVGLVQGLVAGFVTAAGCFAGGWLCNRLYPRTAYATVGLVLALVAVSMALWPATVHAYVVWNLLYAFWVGLAYSAFTAFVLLSMGAGAAAAKYNVFASLSNFPLWWVGLLLGWVADRMGPTSMLLTEAGLGVLGVLVFAVSVYAVRHVRLAD